MVAFKTSRLWRHHGVVTAIYTPAGEIESDPSGIYGISRILTHLALFLSFTPVANISTIPPGASSPFTSFGPVSYKAALFGTPTGIESAIRAERVTVGGIEGIYYGEDCPFQKTSAPLIKLADTNTPVPFSTTGNFTSFVNPVVCSNEIAFTATYSTSGQNQQGVFGFGSFELYGEGPSLYLNLHQLAEVAPDANGAHFARVFLPFFCNSLRGILLGDLG